MTALRATFHFKIRELLVEPELLGTSHEIERGRYRMRLALPTSTEEPQRDDPTLAELDERFPPRDAFPLVERGAELRTSASVSMDGVPEVTMVRVECFFHGAVGVADFEGAESPKVASGWDVAFEALRDADRAAREALRRLLESVRVSGQHWLGPDSGSPRGVARGGLVDLDAGQRLPVTIRLEPELVIKKVEAYQVLDAERLADAVRRVQEAVPPPMEQLLRADALYLLQDAEPPDYPRAVLTAAIACELKVKTMLREHATEEQADLVALLLKRPPMSVHQLFHEPVKILVGKSLCDEDPLLYGRLGKLIERRNGLAHKGETPPDKDEAYEHVKTAVEVFRWLDAVEGVGRSCGPTTRGHAAAPRRKQLGAERSSLARAVAGDHATGWRRSLQAKAKANATGRKRRTGARSLRAYAAFHHPRSSRPAATAAPVTAAAKIVTPSMAYSQPSPVPLPHQPLSRPT